MRLFVAFFLLILLPALTNAQNDTATIIKKDAPGELSQCQPLKINEHAHPLTGCLDCFINLNSDQVDKISPSQKWLTLISIIANSCASNESDHFRKTTFLLNKFGYCDESVYPSEKEKFNSALEKVISGQSPISYKDDLTIQTSFEKYFGIDYATAFFYFCKIPKIPPETKILRLNQFGHQPSPAFLKCTQDSLLNAKTTSKKCLASSIPLESPPSADEINLSINQLLHEKLPAFLRTESKKCFISTANEKLPPLSSAELQKSNQPISLTDGVTETELIAENCKSDGRCQAVIKSSKDLVNKAYKIVCKEDSEDEMDETQPALQESDVFKYPVEYPK